MPKPRPGEKRSMYLRRAIDQIKQEEPESELNYRIAKATGMWNEYQKKRGNKGGEA
jgi:hypothetical protein